MGNHIGIQIKCHNHPQRPGESPAVSLAKLAHGSNQMGGRETFPWPRIPLIFFLRFQFCNSYSSEDKQAFQAGKEGFGTRL